MLRDSRPDLLVESPSPVASKPGIRVCPWGPRDGRLEVVLVTRERECVAQVRCGVERLEEVKAHLQQLWEILEPEAAKPELKLLA
ncbi:MAG TPA: hypothetical protein VFK04_13070 [Gemmatimonadaceae bacterium]|nr:hypothetical protein [Gemmatimonadaceae bacterium]